MPGCNNGTVELGFPRDLFSRFLCYRYRCPRSVARHGAAVCGQPVRGFPVRGWVPRARPFSCWTWCSPVGFAVSYSEVISTLALPPRVTPFVGAATLIYFAIAGVAVTVHAVWGWVSRQFRPAGRSRPQGRVEAAGTALVAAPVLVLGYGSFVERLNFRVQEVDVPLRGPARGSGRAAHPAAQRHPPERLSERADWRA